MSNSSFYKRHDHLVVNYWCDAYWLQLSVVLAEHRKLWMRTKSHPPMYKSATAPILKNRLVRQSVIRGVMEENQTHGTSYFIGGLRFTQADFEAYDQYEECGRLLIRQLATAGPWMELTIHAPPGATVIDD